MSAPTITRLRDGLAINAPYNADFIKSLKDAIPHNKRTWSKPDWVVAKEYEFTITGFILIYYGVPPVIVDKSNEAPEKIQKTIKVEYIGRCKKKDTSNTPSVSPSISGGPSASAWVDGGWTTIILESALRGWFEKKTDRNPDGTDTLYTILGVSMDATQDEIKKSYRRMARQWHPDINREDPDAAEMFKKINDANQKLSDPISRKKYNFMLDVMKRTEPPKDKTNPSNAMKSHYDDLYGYRSPLLCGYLDVEGVMSFGKLVVEKINAWNDITDPNGKTMVTTWINGDKTFTIYWV